MKRDHRMILFGFTEERFPAGTHICQVFTDDKEREDSLLKFLLSGLRSGERASCFSDKTTEPIISEYLGSHGISFEDVGFRGVYSGGSSGYLLSGQSVRSRTNGAMS